MAARRAAEEAREAALQDPPAAAEASSFPPEDDPSTWLPGDEVPPPETESAPFDTPMHAVEVLTLIELERIVDELATTQIGDHPRADDLMQGTVIVLGMGYSGEIQMMVLRCLQLYRELTDRRPTGGGT